MSVCCKSPRKVADAALRVGKEALPTYAHRFAPRKFTRPQLFACLVLKRFFKADYRGIEAILKDMPTLCQRLGLRKVPHFTTLQQAERSMLAAGPTRRLLERSAREAMRPRRRVDLAAADSTGLGASSASRYFVRRRSRSPGGWQATTYKRYPKLGLLCDVRSHAILSLVVGRGPRPDTGELPVLLDQLPRSVTLIHLLADAGYDSEANHAYARHEHGIRTTIPPRAGRPTGRRPSGYYRRLMTRGFHRRPYGQRWQSETVHRMLKAHQGSAVAARRYTTQCRELRLAAITHNVMIAIPQRVLYRAGLTPFSIPRETRHVANTRLSAFILLGPLKNPPPCATLVGI